MAHTPPLTPVLPCGTKNGGSYPSLTLPVINFCLDTLWAPSVYFEETARIPKSKSGFLALLPIDPDKLAEEPQGQGKHDHFLSWIPASGTRSPGAFAWALCAGGSADRV